MDSDDDLQINWDIWDPKGKRTMKKQNLTYDDTSAIPKNQDGGREKTAATTIRPFSNLIPVLMKKSSSHANKTAPGFPDPGNLSTNQPGSHDNMVLKESLASQLFDSFGPPSSQSLQSQAHPTQSQQSRQNNNTSRSSLELPVTEPEFHPAVPFARPQQPVTESEMTAAFRYLGMSQIVATRSNPQLQGGVPRTGQFYPTISHARSLSNLQHPESPLHVKIPQVEERTSSQERGQLLPTLQIPSHITRGPDEASVSPNYRGNPRLQRNLSAPIEHHENCSLFLTNLPPDCTIHSLLGAMRGTGKVWSSNINRPELEKGHILAAAKVVFFDRASAERLFIAVKSRLFLVQGLVPNIVWNRTKVAAQTPSHVSRVLIIHGPRAIVNRRELSAFFASRFVWDTDEVLELDTDPRGHLATIEWRFGSYRAQAEAASLFLRSVFGKNVNLQWGIDPCA